MTVRTRILLSATRRFASRGFDGTSIQEVADDVQVTKQAVLHHFASKDELRVAVLENLLAHWASTLPRLLFGATEGDERYELVMTELCGFFYADPDRARLLVREVLDRPEEMTELLTQKVRPFIEAVSKYVRKGQETGELYSNVDPEAYLVALVLQVISGIAALDCVGVLLTGSPSARRSRFIQEIVRSGKRSLFHDSIDKATPTPAQKAKKARKKTPKENAS